MSGINHHVACASGKVDRHEACRVMIMVQSQATAAKQRCDAASSFMTFHWRFRQNSLFMRGQDFQVLQKINGRRTHSVTGACSRLGVAQLAAAHARVARAHVWVGGQAVGQAVEAAVELALQTAETTTPRVMRMRALLWALGTAAGRIDVPAFPNSPCRWWRTCPCSAAQSGATSSASPGRSPGSRSSCTEGRPSTPQRSGRI